MRGLDLIAVLLLLLSWRRVGDNSMVSATQQQQYGIKFGEEESESDGESDSEEESGNNHDDFDLEMSHSHSHWNEADHTNAIRHKIFPQMAMIDKTTTRLEKVRIGSGRREEGKQLIRHSSRFLDKLLLSRRSGNMSSIATASRFFSYGRRNLTISELIENLRGMRARRRRSSIANLKLSESKMSLGSPLARLPKKIAEIDGQIVLGGLMMVHERGDVLTCGPIMPQGGIQALETMLYTVDILNKQKFLPGIFLGVHILDDCDKDTYGLEQAVDFIKGIIYSSDPVTNQELLLAYQMVKNCNSGFLRTIHHSIVNQMFGSALEAVISVYILRSISNIDDVEDLGGKCLNGSVSSLKNKVIAGVVGAASSVTSIQVANLLRLFRIPQVSYFSTSPELSAKPRFDFFSRTIPSDKNQVQVMVDIIELFHWKYVSIVYEESNYGTKAFEELEKILPERKICIAAKEKLVKDSGVANDASYDQIVEKLKEVPKAKGVIVFGSDQEVKALMRAVRRRNATGAFTWIGSDGWSSRTLVSDGNEREVEGTLSVQPRANPVQGFDEYFFSLNVKNNTRNPWFVEFWEHHFLCIFPNSTRTRYNQNFTLNCTGDEKLTRENTQFEAQLQFVSDAVMAFAHAFRSMHNVMCGGYGKPGLCEKMKPIDGSLLLTYLKNVSFIGLSGDDFHFDPSGDGPARYNIIHFRKVGESFQWVRVGEYNEGNLTLRMEEIQFADGSSTAPVSVCSDPCGLGEEKRIVVGIPCCWSCNKCLNDQIRHEINESSCFTCALGTLPNSNHVKCIPIPEVYLQPTSGWGIGAMAFAGIGILLTLFVFTVFIVHNDTPVVRASGRELSFVLLSGLFLCYSLTFLFVVFRPNDIICGIQQFGTGFCFTMVYSALATKTNRIARIFQAGRRSARRPSFISPRSQLVICSMLLSIQVIINIVWMLLQPPQAMHHYPTREDNLLVCNTYINASYTIAFAYPIGLIVVCTVYAVLTRKIPEAFNESKYIGFTMYTTCIIWLAFVPIYFSTANQVALRITSMTVAISLSATVMIVCLFSPKLYIILFHPERNVRQSMMPVNTNRFSALAHNATVGGATGSGGGTASISTTAGGQLKAIIPMSTLSTVRPNHVENFSVAHSKVDCSTQIQSEDFCPDEKVRRLREPSEEVEKSTCATQTENNNINPPEQINGLSDGRNVPSRVVTFVTPIHEKNSSLIDGQTEWTNSTEC